MTIKYSVVIPVYKNAESIARLLDTLDEMATTLVGSMEAIFVVDGSPDECYAMIRAKAETSTFAITLVSHAKNFGSFAAIRTGLNLASGKYFGVMAADLQEPPSLILDFFELLESDQCDVVVGERVARDDSFTSDLASNLFWWAYRRIINPEMPAGGVDIFGCNDQFRSELIRLNESHSSLIALVFWLGFRRKNLPYQRQKRLQGKSSWSLAKKIEYMSDSIFAFTNLPIRILSVLGAVGLLISLTISTTIVIAHSIGAIEVSGYVPIMLAVLALGSLNLIGLGVVGNYAWRAFENSKARPLSIVARTYTNHHYEK